MANRLRIGLEGFAVADYLDERYGRPAGPAAHRDPIIAPGLVAVHVGPGDSVSHSATLELDVVAPALNPAVDDPSELAIRGLELVNEALNGLGRRCDQLRVEVVDG